MPRGDTTTKTFEAISAERQRLEGLKEVENEDLLKNLGYKGDRNKLEEEYNALREEEYQLAKKLKLVSEDAWKNRKKALEKTIELNDKRIKQQKNINKGLKGAWGNVKGFLKSHGGTLGIATGTKLWSGYERQVGLVHRQMNNFAEKSLHKTVANMQNLGLKTEWGAQKYIDYATAVNKARLDHSAMQDEYADTKHIENYTDLLITLEEGIGLSRDRMIEFGQTMKFVAGFDMKQSAMITKSVTDDIVDVGKAYNMSGENIEEMMNAVSKATPSLVFAHGKIGASGRVMFDPDNYKTAISGMTGMTAELHRMGISASESSAMLNNLMDIDRMEENMYVLTQMGVSVTDIMSQDYGKVAGQIEKNLGGVVSRVFQAPKMMRATMFKALAPVLGKDQIAKIVTAQAQGKSVEETVADLRKKGGATGVEGLGEAVQDDVGIRMEQFGAQLTTLNSMIHPSATAIKFLGDVASKTAQALGGMVTSTGSALSWLVTGAIGLKMFGLSGRGIMGGLGRGGAFLKGAGGASKMAQGGSMAVRGMRSMGTLSKFAKVGKVGSMVGMGGKLGAGVGMAKAGIGTALATGKAVAGALLSNPIGWAILATAAIGTGIYLLYKNSDKAKERARVERQVQERKKIVLAQKQYLALKGHGDKLSQIEDVLKSQDKDRLDEEAKHLATRGRATGEMQKMETVLGKLKDAGIDPSTTMAGQVAQKYLGQFKDLKFRLSDPSLKESQREGLQDKLADSIRFMKKDMDKAIYSGQKFAVKGGEEKAMSSILKDWTKQVNADFEGKKIMDFGDKILDKAFNMRRQKISLDKQLEEKIKLEREESKGKWSASDKEDKIKIDRLELLRDADKERAQARVKLRTEQSAEMKALIKKMDEGNMTREQILKSSEYQTLLKKGELAGKQQEKLEGMAQHSDAYQQWLDSTDRSSKMILAGAGNSKVGG